MDTKKLRGTLIGDYEVSGAVDNVWIDTSNPNKVLTKVFIKDKWKSIADSASTEEAIAFAEQGLAGKTDKVTDAVNGNLAALDASGNLTDSGKNISDFLSAAANTGTDGQILEYTPSGPQWANAPEGTVVVDSAMSDSSTNAIQNKVVKAYVDLKADKTALDNYALKTGSYDTLTAGMAKNIEGQSTNEGTYLERPTAYPTDVATGVASVEQIKGHSVVWNQLVKNGNFVSSDYWSGGTVVDNVYTCTKEATGTATTHIAEQSPFSYVNNHKYIFLATVKSNNEYTKISLLPTGVFADGASEYTLYSEWTNLHYFWTRTGIYKNLQIRGYNQGYPNNDISFSIKNVMCFDLTLMFGAGNEPTTVAEVDAWLEQNVGLKPYYAYDTGSILNNKLTGFKTIGRNLLNPTTKTARLLSYEYGDNDNKFCIKNLPTGATLSFTPDATGVAETVTPDSNGIFTISGTGTLTVTTESDSDSLADTYVCFVWDGTMNDEPVAYKDHTYDFDVTKIYGQLNGAGDLTQVYPNGMLSAGSVKDVLTANAAVVNVKDVDLGNVSYSKFDTADSTLFRIDNSGITYPRKSGGLGSTVRAICSNYIVVTIINRAENTLSGTSQNFDFINSSYSDTTDFKTAMSGVMLNYELATPLVYTNLVYRDNGVDTPLSEIFPINMLVDNWSTEQALVTAYSSGAPTSCAPTVKTLFGLDVAEWIDSANNGTFISANSMDAFLSALGTAMGGTWSKTWDSTNNKWDFTFTPSNNFLATGIEASGTWGVDETTNALTLTPDEE